MISKEIACLLRNVLSLLPMGNFEKSKLELNNLMTTEMFVVSFYAPEEQGLAM